VAEFVLFTYFWADRGGNAMKKCFGRSRSPLAIVALAVAATMSTVSIAHAASAGTGGAARTGTAAASRSMAASDAPCTFIPAQTCQSTNPTVTLNIDYTGDTSACIFVWNVAWGDGNSSSNLTVGGPPDGYVLLAQHTYAAPGVYTITVTGGVTDGACTAGEFTVRFTLSSRPPSPPKPALFYSGNYAGWSETGLTGTDRYVAAHWTVPRVQCAGQLLHPGLLPSKAWAAPWVGLAGGPNTAHGLANAWLSQVGTISQCTFGLNTANYAFVELASDLPGGEPPKLLFRVNANDKMYGQVESDGEVNGQLRLYSYISDLTTGKSAQGYIFPTHASLTQAEYQAIVTVERWSPDGGLAKFPSPIQFTGVQFSKGTGLTQFTMVAKHTTLAVAGSLGSSPPPYSGAAFKVFWKRWIN
jgi:hypothetical protein